jgi:adenylate cyclase
VTHTSSPPSPAGRRRRAALVGLALGLVAAAAAAGLSRLSFFDRAESSSYDLRVAYFAPPLRPGSPVVIVTIDEQSLRTLEPVVGRWPWPRLVHGSAVDYLARSGAKVIAFDVLFSEHEGRSESVINGRVITGDESDGAFVDAVERAGNVVLLADATFEGTSSDAATPAGGTAPPVLPGPAYHPGPGFESRPTLRPPFLELARVAAGVGHNYLRKDPGSDAARRFLPFIVHGDAAVPSLGLAAALAFIGATPDDVRIDGNVLRIGDRAMPLQDDPVIDASGHPEPSREVLTRLPRPTTGADGVRSMFPTYPFFNVLLSADQSASGQAPAIPPSAFKDKLVFIGTTASGLFDRYATPFPGGAPGVALHAALADNVIANQFMRRASRWADLGVTVAMAIAAGVSAALLPVVAAAAVTVALLAALVVWLGREVTAGVWIAEVAPATAAVLALFAGVAWRYFVEDREKRHVRRLFGRYVSKDVVDQLMADPGLVKLGGQRRTMTVLFSDIRGFTSASEEREPEAVVAQLNEYFGAMVDVLFRHQGTLDKFVGDMVMGLFGAPLADPLHADHAVAAAVEMSTTLAALNARWAAEGKPALAIGIGINTGEMIAGNIGSEAIMSYTVIGDAVNLGARLESLNKAHGTQILISERTRAALTRPVPTREIGEVTVKGRTRPVRVYEVGGAPGGRQAEASSPRELEQSS